MTWKPEGMIHHATYTSTGIDEAWSVFSDPSGEFHVVYHLLAEDPRDGDGEIIFRERTHEKAMLAALAMRVAAQYRLTRIAKEASLHVGPDRRPSEKDGSAPADVNSGAEGTGSTWDATIIEAHTKALGRLDELLRYYLDSAARADWVGCEQISDELHAARLVIRVISEAAEAAERWGSSP